jgi:4-hydroxy-3-polyprenylbenzoate decarboxylase
MVRLEGNPMTSDFPLVVAVTGGSGAVYATRLLDVLLDAGREVHLVISPTAAQVFRVELGVDVDLASFEPVLLLRASTKRLTYWHFSNFSAGIASGSFRTAGMVIVPCSMSTLASVACGVSTNLIHRAAEVHLKERRKLILVPRETPLHLVGIENMAAATRAGAVVLPAMPAFYNNPQSIADLVDFVVSRICDQLDVKNDLTARWGENPD